MKSSTLLSVLFPIAAVALPATTPNMESGSSIIEGRANKCFLHKEAIEFQPLGCDSDPYNGHRSRPVRAADRLDITCWGTGKTVTWTFDDMGTKTSNRWAYWRDKKCWVWAAFLQNGCTTGLEQC